MKYLLTTSLLLHASLAAVIDTRDDGDALALVPRAPRTVAQHCGTFPLQCQGAEGACNNACFHIQCINPATRRKTYVGPKNEAAAKRNRYDSGNTMQVGGALCRTFPFSQVLVDDQAASAGNKYTTDEWPMASCQQVPFAQRAGNQRNSLRCILGTENFSAGGKFSAFENDNGPSRAQRVAACAGTLIAGDTYDVTFNLAGADMTKVPHCVSLNANTPNPNCDDPLQARLNTKNTQNGKASSPYDPPLAAPHAPGGTDNTYALQFGTHPNIMQCSVEFMRSEHFEVEARVVDWNNQDLPSVRQNHPNGQYTMTLAGLPYNLVVTSTGTLGSRLNFEYGTAANTAAHPHADLSHFAWNTDSEGAGAGVDGNAAARFCKVVDGTVQYNPNDATYHLGLKGDPKPTAVRGLKQQKTELTKCFFPCFTVANI